MSKDLQGLGQKVAKTLQELKDQIIHGLDEKTKHLVILKEVIY